jgi:hypothetical protein
MGRGRKTRGTSLMRPSFITVWCMPHLSCHHWVRDFVISYLLTFAAQRMTNSQQLSYVGVIIWLFTEIFRERRSRLFFNPGKSILALVFCHFVPIMTISEMTSSRYRQFPASWRNRYNVGCFNSLTSECVVRVGLCKIVRRALHRERPSKKSLAG